MISFFERITPEIFEKSTSSKLLQGRLTLYLQNLPQTAEKIGVSVELLRYKFIQAHPVFITSVIVAQNDLTLK